MRLIKELGLWYGLKVLYYQWRRNNAIADWFCGRMPRDEARLWNKLYNSKIELAYLESQQGRNDLC